MKKIQAILTEVADRVETAVQRHLPELQQHLPEHLFQGKKGSENDVATMQRRVPRSIDLTYVTQQLIVMSAPAEGLNASRTDNGREDPQIRKQLAKSNTQMEESQSTEAQSLITIPPSKIRHIPQHEAIIGFENPDLNVDVMLGKTANLIASLGESDEHDEVTSGVQQSLPQHQTLDVFPNTLQQKNPQKRITLHCTAKEQPIDKSLLQGNNPSTLSTFLHQHHSDHFLAMNLTNVPANDRTLTLLRRQVANVYWASPKLEKSETPTLSHLLEVVYMMHAYIQLDSTKNTIVLYCQNGKTRSAIVTACYLKFSGAVHTALIGFEYFLLRRCPKIAKEAVAQLPPSLRQLLTCFDATVDRLDYGNRKPLLLRAIALQGVPVEDQPCLDVYCQNKHIYSSSSNTCQWADEEGFYRISQKLEGDFLIIVRFGGEYSSDSHDCSKVLFRYAQTTGFCTCGPLELPKSKVDMMRRYASSFDEGDFLLTLLFESYWDGNGKNMAEYAQESPLLVQVLHGDAATERGLQLLTERLATTTNAMDISRLRQVFATLKECPDHVCTLALQFSDHDLEKTNYLLTESKMQDWWKDINIDVEEECLSWPFDDRVPVSNDRIPTCYDILKILDDDVVVDYQHDTSWSRNHDHASEESLLIYDSIHVPCRGDIVSLLPWRMDQQEENSLDHSKLKPRLPRKRRFTETVEAPKRARPEESHSDQADRQAAMELLIHVNHTGITLDDLLQLQKNARNVGVRPVQVLERPIEVANEEVDDTVDEMVDDEIGDSGKSEADPPDTTRVLGLLVDEPKPLLVNKEEEKKDEELEENPPLQRDPHYKKYFNMTRMGMSVEVAKHAMQRDGLDPNIMDLDPEKSLKDQQTNTVRDGDELPLKDDPEFAKYFKMLKMGMPVEVAKHAMKRDGKEDSILDLDSNKSLKAQRKESECDDVHSPALEDDPEYGKYFKMLKMGLPHDAVKHSLQRDGKEPSILDLDPKKSLLSQTKADAPIDGPLKDDPDYEKYFKMLKMGLPLGAVKNSLVRDGKDPAIMDLDPDKSLASQMSLTKEDDDPPLKDDEEYSKYFKMLKMGLPIGAVKNAISRDGKDPSVLDLDPEKSLKIQKGSERDESTTDTGTPLKDDPEYSKYFKMMKMGLPPGAVKNAVSRDGKDPSILDLDPEMSVAFQLAQKKNGRVRGGIAGGARATVKKRRKVRRKKIYWTPIDASKLHEESLWSIVKGSVTMETLKFDVTEFESLFTESTNPADKKTQAAKGGGDGKAKQKKSTQVIDGKRGMNGGIILARLKIKYEMIADMVDTMNAGEFDSTQLKALKEFLPTDDDRTNLVAYLKPGEDSEKAKDQVMSDLSECEKYMVAMMKVVNPVAKFDAMFFKFNFSGRMGELEQGIITVKKACDEVRSSERLRKMMAMILTLVNHINTGGDGTLADGFSLDALLKLNEAKAFDKKTSVLEYLVKLVRENDMSLLDFKLDIETVPIAQNIVLDGLISDTKLLSDELQSVHETAKSEADRLEEQGKLIDLTLTQLKEQRTAIREIGGIAHYNKVDHKSGRTPMERFTLFAKQKVDSSLAALGELKDNYSKVLAYFGEDENMSSNDFFGTLQKFILEFKTAAEKVDLVERQRVKEKLQAAAKQAAAVNKLGAIAKALTTQDKISPIAQSTDKIAALAASREKCKSVAIENVDGGIPLKDDPSFGKYFKMLKMGLSVDAVKHTLKRDGQDPNVLDLDPEKSLEFQNHQNISVKEEVSMPGGIAAMAAAATSTKDAVKSSNFVWPTPFCQDTAPTAKDPVSKRKAGNDEGKIERYGPQPVKIETTSPLASTRGIAAMVTAAEAAREKLISTAVEGICPNAVSESITPFTSDRNDPGGQADIEKDCPSRRRGLNPRGIAAMAAASAIKLKDGSKLIVGNAITAASDSDVLNRFTGLGTVHEVTSSHVGLSIGSAYVGGGIAAMAAAAAKRNKATQQNGTTEDIDTPIPLSGGAKMAMNSQGKPWKSQGTSPPALKTAINPFAGGGIAAAAAAAAAKRNNSEQNSGNTSPNGVVIRNEDKASPLQGNSNPEGKVFFNPNDSNSHKEISVKNSFQGGKTLVDSSACTDTVSVIVAVGTGWKGPDEPNDDQSLRSASCPSPTGAIILEEKNDNSSISDTTRRYMERTSTAARIKVVSAKGSAIYDGSMQNGHVLNLVGSRNQGVEESNYLAQDENHGTASVSVETLHSTCKPSACDNTIEGITDKSVGKIVHELGMVDVCRPKVSLDERVSKSVDAELDEASCLEKISMGEALQTDVMGQVGQLGHGNDEITDRRASLHEENVESSGVQKYEGENGFQKWFGKLGMKEENNHNNNLDSTVKTSSQEESGFSSFFRQFSVKSNLGDEAAPSPAMDKV